MGTKKGDLYRELGLETVKNILGTVVLYQLFLRAFKGSGVCHNPRVQAAPVLIETEEVAHLFHSSLNLEFIIVHCF